MTRLDLSCDILVSVDLHFCIVILGYGYFCCEFLRLQMCREINIFLLLLGEDSFGDTQEPSYTEMPFQIHLSTHSKDIRLPVLPTARQTLMGTILSAEITELVSNRSSYSSSRLNIPPVLQAGSSLSISYQSHKS